MADYDNTNRGVLFKNDRKDQDSHPDYKGSININGTEFWLSAWIKDGQKGKFMSLAVKPKDAQAPAPGRTAQRGGYADRREPTPAARRGGFDDMNDDAPPF